MELFVLLGALGMIGVVAAVAAGRVRGGLDEPTTSRPYRGLPEQPLVPTDVDAVRFTLALRGYRMDEVDDVLARLRDELADRNHEVARLRSSQESTGTAPHAPAPGATDPDGSRAPDGVPPDAQVPDDVTSR